MFDKKRIPLYAGLVVTAILITATGIIFKQSFLRIMPLYVSLIIMLLQTNVNRYAPLLGGLNSLLYGFVFLYYRVYGQVANAFLVSFPMQIFAFFYWSKNRRGIHPTLKRLTVKQRVIGSLLFVLLTAGLCFILAKINGSYIILDSILFILGLIITALNMFAYVEAPFLNIINAVASIILYIRMSLDTPEQLTYLIYSLYSFVCIILTCVKVTSLYAEQQKE